MIQDAKLSTKVNHLRYGGLLICGLNYGLPKNGISQSEAEFEPWAEYFTHPSNRFKDRFVSRLVTWFEWWNIPLEYEKKPTGLNNAISQTNLFYDSSQSFTQRSKEDFELAFERLGSIIKNLNISGLLLTSTQICNIAKDRLAIQKWHITKSGRFTFYQAMSDNYHVGIIPHPRCPVSKNDVTKMRGQITNWIESVMLDYQRKQN